MLFFDKLWPDQEVRPHRPSIGYREISLWGPVLLKQSFKQTAARHTAGGNQKEGGRGILPPAEAKNGPPQKFFRSSNFSPPSAVSYTEALPGAAPAAARQFPPKGRSSYGTYD